MEKNKLEILDNFMCEINKFTKIICKLMVQDFKDKGLQEDNHFIVLYFTPVNLFFGCHISDRDRVNFSGKTEHYTVNLIDFIDNQKYHIDKYKDLIIKYLKDDKLIVKSNLCFYLSHSIDNEILLNLHVRNMNYLRLCSDLDYSATRFGGAMNSFKEFLLVFDSIYQVKAKYFQGGYLERNKFFADYYTLIKNVIGINHGVKDIGDLYYFFSRVGVNLTQKQIEAPFIKIIENKTMKKDFILLKNVSNIICHLVGENNIKSKELKNLKIECEYNMENKYFTSLIIKGFKAITFNDNYFLKYNFKYENPACFKKLSEFEMDSFHDLLMYLLTSKEAQEIYGVVKSSAFHLPTGERGFFMQVNESYCEEKLHQGIEVMCKFIQEETIREPLMVLSSKFEKYEREEVINALYLYILEIKLKEVKSIQHQQESNLIYTEKYKINKNNTIFDLEFKDNIESISFKTLSIKGLKAITFNNNYFSEYSFKYENPESFVKLRNSQIEKFYNLLMYLLTSKEAQEIYGVMKSSAFQLPTGEEGFLMQVNENYNEDKLNTGIGVMCKFIQNITIKEPLKISYTSFKRYQSEKVLIELNPYLLEIKLKKVMDFQEQTNFVYIDEFKI